MQFGDGGDWRRLDVEQRFPKFRRATAAVAGALLPSVAVVGMLLEWEDALVLGAVTAVVRGMRRKGWAIASVLLVAAAFPPWGWPTWWCCYTPLLGLWRGSEDSADRNVCSTFLQRSLGRDLIEALTIGFAMCWLTTGFVRDAVATRGVLLQASGCVLFGLQMLLFPIA
ncbi:MAG: hypothetical protein AB7I48_20615, partial [Planctomycetaceae bacterium]